MNPESIRSNSTTPPTTSKRAPGDQASAQGWLMLEPHWQFVVAAARERRPMQTLVAQLRERIALHFGEPTDLSAGLLADAIRAAAMQAGDRDVITAYGAPDRPNPRRAGRPRKQPKAKPTSEPEAVKIPISAVVGDAGSGVKPILVKPILNEVHPKAPITPPSGRSRERTDTGAAHSQERGSPSFLACQVCHKPMNTRALTYNEWTIITCEDPYCPGASREQLSLWTYLCPHCCEVMDWNGAYYQCAARVQIGKRSIYAHCKGRRDNHGKDISEEAACFSRTWNKWDFLFWPEKL